MTQSFALKNLLDIATSETDSAAARLGELNRQVLLQEQKLKLLLQYRADYQERLRGAVANGLDSAGLRNFNDFISRLEQALQQQQASLDEARGRAEHGLRQWQAKARRSKAFGTLAQRAAETSLRKENSREQKAQDDFASRSALQASCPLR